VNETGGLAVQRWSGWRSKLLSNPISLQQHFAYAYSRNRPGWHDSSGKLLRQRRPAARRARRRLTDQREVMGRGVIPGVVVG
jgi:hypothetical protein